MAKVREFIAALDAFPKVSTECLEFTRRGGMTTLVLYAILIVLGFSEFLRYVWPPVRQTFVVDPALGKFVPLTIDVSVATSCDQIVVILTNKEDVKVILDSQLSFRSEGRWPRWLTTNQDADIRDTCRIRGRVPISRSSGILSILPVLATAGNIGTLILAGESSINFSHHIHKISVGDRQGRHNEIHSDPLNSTSQHTMSAHEHYTYFCSVISMYKLFGESFGQLMSGSLYDRSSKSHVLSAPSHRYAISGFQGKRSLYPGIIFKFNYEPLAVVEAYDRLSFFEFLVKIFGILGGVYTSISILHSLISIIVNIFQRAVSKPPQNDDQQHEPLINRKIHVGTNPATPPSPSRFI